MWEKAMVFVLAAASVVSYEFDPHDQISDFMDEPEGPAESNPRKVSEIASLGAQTKGVHDEVEKLLGQPVFHYEDPATTPASSAQVQRSRLKDLELNKEPLEESEEERTTKQESKLGVQNKEIQRKQSQKGSQHKDFQQLTKKAVPEREQTVQGMVPEWSHEVTTRNAPEISSIELSITKPRRRPKLRTKYSRQTMQEVVYSIGVPWEAEHQKVGRAPGVIESIVAGHDIVHRERPGLAPARAQDTHVLTAKDGSARRNYLLSVPDSLTSRSTRRRRPTPVTQTIYTTYKYTRITRRHPNCTDSYYDCLLKCFDNRGFRVRCPWQTPTKRAEPARLNFTGLFKAITSDLWDWDTSELLKRFREIILEKGYRDCKCTTVTTRRTYAEILPQYYDDMITNKTGAVMAKCWVCGLLDQGVPTNSYCADNFGALGNSLALAEKSSYRKNCRYMDEVPLWYNSSDPFSIYGTWTGGCSTRWIDLSGLYTQRTCRSEIHPATGQHFMSRRMAMLELALRGEKNGCVVSPMATLVPFSRAISLYGRIHVCVCTGTFCNHAHIQTQNLGVFMAILLFYCL